MTTFIRRPLAEWRQEEGIFGLPERKLHTVFWHCTASDIPEHDSIDVIDSWHQDPPRRWSEVGYHGMIHKNGDFSLGRPWFRIPAAQGGYNLGALAFVLHGLKADLFTPAQAETMRWLAALLDRKRGERGEGPLRHRGHCEVSAKTCPVIDYRSILFLDSSGYQHVENIGAQVPDNLDCRRRLLEILSVDAACVRELQTLLRELGYDLEVDGLFGRETEREVRHFQRNSGLVEDGLVGPDTWGTILELVEEERAT